MVLSEKWDWTVRKEGITLQLYGYIFNFYFNLWNKEITSLYYCIYYSNKDMCVYYSNKDMCIYYSNKDMCIYYFYKKLTKTSNFGCLILIFMGTFMYGI